MKFIGPLVLMAFAACLFAGCGSSKNDSAGNAAKHPKYPGIFVTIRGADGHSGCPFWHEENDGYEQYPNVTRRDSTKDGTPVACKPVYTGTTDAGDAFVLEVSIGETQETKKKVVYEGTRIEIDIADGVEYIMEPDPF